MQFSNLPTLKSLRCRKDFQFVYANGRRINGRFITVFFTLNDLPFSRFGLTVSRKVSARATDRNRAKRLIRESLRLSFSQHLNGSQHFDLVFNARRSLLRETIDSVIVDVKSLLAQVN